jgi:hypothetical protein
MACSCGGNKSSGVYQVQAPNGTITSWSTKTEAEAAASRTGGRVLPR